MNTGKFNLYQYQTYIFDFDGVIADSNAIKEKAINKSVDNFTEKETRQKFLEFFIANNGIPREIKVNKFFSKNISEKILSEYSKILKKELRKVNLIKGVKDFIVSLEDKDLYILSGGDKREITDILEEKKIKNYFKKVLAGPEKKDKNFLEINKKGKIIFFGDSAIDYQLAKENNLDFIFLYGATSMKNWENELEFNSTSQRMALSFKDFIELKLC